jgi:hypothetical protein
MREGEMTKLRDTRESMTLLVKPPGDWTSQGIVLDRLDPFHVQTTGERPCIA